MRRRGISVSRVLVLPLGSLAVLGGAAVTGSAGLLSAMLPGDAQARVALAMEAGLGLEGALHVRGGRGQLDPMDFEKRLRQARKEGLIDSDYLGLQIDEAEKAQVISKAEANSLRDYHEKVSALLDVDDFAPEEMTRRPADSAPPPAEIPAKKTTGKKTPATQKKATRKKASKKKSAKT